VIFLTLNVFFRVTGEIQLRAGPVEVFGRQLEEGSGIGVILVEA